MPAPVCAGVTEPLITIHGQSEQTRLGTADRQRELLDRFAGDAVEPVLARYRAGYAERRSAAAELDRLRSAAQARAREVDLLRFGLGEIEQVDPQPGEDVALAAEARRLQSADDLRQTASTALARVAGGDDEAGGALSDVTTARKALEAGIGDETLAAIAGRLAELGYGLADVAGDLAGYLGDLEAEPGRLEQIAARRAALAGLTRKYGASADEVLAWGADAARRLAELEAGDDRVEVLAARVAELDARAGRAGGRVDRGPASRGGRFRPCGGHRAGAAGACRTPGWSSTSPRPSRDRPARTRSSCCSAPTRAASRAAWPRWPPAASCPGSGWPWRWCWRPAGPAGPWCSTRWTPASAGRVATEIGRRLAQLARHNQVVVVTHLAQVAAFADRHYVVVKADDGQVTTSGVSLVTDEQRAAELARMMAGLEATESALAHAGELVELAASARRTELKNQGRRASERRSADERRSDERRAFFPSAKRDDASVGSERRARATSPN